MMDYVIIGLVILVFIFQLITLWYVWWVYTTVNGNVEDAEDMLVDIYTLELAAAKSRGIEIVAKIPKRIQNRLDKRK